MCTDRKERHQEEDVGQLRCGEVRLPVLYQAGHLFITTFLYRALSLSLNCSVLAYVLPTYSARAVFDGVRGRFDPPREVADPQ